jgi:ribosomal protein S18 acetylase RimI-like enzyme
MRITYQSALHLSLPQIAELHSMAYGGWVSKPETLADIFRVQSVDLKLSLVAYDGRKAIGLALLGRRRAHGWLYDFAVSPKYRGQGLGTRLLQTTTREAERAGVRDLELDVWEKRDDAIRLYQRAGFQHMRSYLIFQSTGAELQLNDDDLPSHWSISPALVKEITPWYAAAANEPEAAWDRRLPSLLSYGDARALTLADQQGPAAFMHYAARPASGTDPNRIRPMFVGLRPGMGVPVLRALFLFAARDAFGEVATTAFRVALEPETSTLAALLTTLGMKPVARALDMRLRVT